MFHICLSICSICGLHMDWKWWAMLHRESNISASSCNRLNQRFFITSAFFFTYCLIQRIQKSAHLMPGFCGVKKRSLRYIIKFSCSSRTFFTFASSRHSLQRAYQVSKGCLCWKVSDKGEVQQNKELNIPWNAVRAVDNKQRKYGTTMTLQKPMKRRKQIREAIKRPR